MKQVISRNGAASIYKLWHMPWKREQTTVKGINVRRSFCVIATFPGKLPLLSTAVGNACYGSLPSSNHSYLSCSQFFNSGKFGMMVTLLHSVLCRMVVGLENPLFVGSFLPAHVFLGIMWKLAVLWGLGIGFSPGGLLCELVELLPVWWLSSMREWFENYTSYCPVSEAAWVT